MAALSLSASGGTGEMVLPMLLMLLIVLFGWRISWIGFAFIVIAVYLPIAFWLLGKSQLHFQALKAAPIESSSVRSHNRREVIRDWRFWLVIPVVLAAPFMVTGVLFSKIIY